MKGLLFGNAVFTPGPAFQLLPTQGVQGQSFFWQRVGEIDRDERPLHCNSHIPGLTVFVSTQRKCYFPHPIFESRWEKMKETKSPGFFDFPERMNRCGTKCYLF